MEIVQGVCYTGSTGKSEENISTQDIRERLKDEILSLSDKQAEYVLNRLLCFLQEQYGKEVDP